MMSRQQGANYNNKISTTLTALFHLFIYYAVFQVFFLEFWDPLGPPTNKI